MRPASMDVRAILRKRDDHKVRLPVSAAMIATDVEVGFWSLNVSRRLR